MSAGRAFCAHCSSSGRIAARSKWAAERLRPSLLRSAFSCHSCTSSLTSKPAMISADARPTKSAAYAKISSVCSSSKRSRAGQSWSRRVRAITSTMISMIVASTPDVTISCTSYDSLTNGFVWIERHSRIATTQRPASACTSSSVIHTRTSTMHSLRITSISSQKYGSGSKRRKRKPKSARSCLSLRPRRGSSQKSTQQMVSGKTQP
mmetsp:Transcript_61414/g.168730  ORF Transcript_61414/g.168730 Transcript_61414/m.168730 type:complete len:207 (-) Transcript_61414:1064-1684(-)